MIQTGMLEKGFAEEKEFQLCPKQWVELGQAKNGIPRVMAGTEAKSWRQK